MRVYLDDDLDSNALIRFLHQAGHQAVSPRDVGTRGISDEGHLRYAAEHALTLLTANARDFVDLHEAWRFRGQEHHGILVVYRENDPVRDMTLEQIADAVTLLEQSNLPLTNGLHNLNYWRRRGS